MISSVSAPGKDCVMSLPSEGNCLYTGESTIGYVGTLGSEKDSSVKSLNNSTQTILALPLMNPSYITSHETALKDVK